MFGNWFSERNAESGVKTSELNSNTRPRSTSVSAGLYTATSSDQRQVSAMSPPQSPRDAVIGQIDNALRELHAAGTPHPVSSPNPESTIQQAESLPAGTRSRELPENMYDPFDGQSIGLMVPGEFGEEEDDLWTHLAKIRNLQSDIARMHAQMERLGENDRLYGVGQATEDEATNAEDEAKAAKAVEFAKLSDRFNGRKEAIDAVMQKLETLSRSISDFHSSRGPMFCSLSSGDAPDHKKSPGNLATVSSHVSESPGHTEFNNSILSQDALKDSPESFGHSLVDHPDT